MREGGASGSGRVERGKTNWASMCYVGGAEAQPDLIVARVAPVALRCAAGRERGARTPERAQGAGLAMGGLDETQSRVSSPRHANQHTGNAQDVHSQRQTERVEQIESDWIAFARACLIRFFSPDCAHRAR